MEGAFECCRVKLMGSTMDIWESMMGGVDGGGSGRRGETGRQSHWRRLRLDFYMHSEAKVPSRHWSQPGRDASEQKPKEWRARLRMLGETSARAYFRRRHGWLRSVCGPFGLAEPAPSHSLHVANAGQTRAAAWFAGSRCVFPDARILLVCTSTVAS